MKTEFPAAPWGIRVRLITWLLIGLLLFVAPVISFFLPGMPPWVIGLLFVMMLAIVGITLLFVVRGFRLAGNTLLIRRSFWDTSIPLAGLQSAEVDSRACVGAWKTMGNDGLFAMHGWFWSKRLGKFRAFVTDPASSVVLRFADRVVVVSPDRPRRLVETLEPRLSQTETFNVIGRASDRDCRPARPRSVVASSRRPSRAANTPAPRAGNRLRRG